MRVKPSFYVSIRIPDIAEIILFSNSSQEACYMHSIAKKVLAVGYGTLLVAFSLPAAPKISVDSANFDFGTILEGEQKSVKHTFIIKNNGDDTLRIEKVKPG